MDDLLIYIATAYKAVEGGDIKNYAEPDAPSDLGEALTTDEINFLKAMIKDIRERFSRPLE